MIGNGKVVLVDLLGAVQFGVIIATASRMDRGQETCEYTVAIRSADGSEKEVGVLETSLCETHYSSVQEQFLRERTGHDWARQKAREVSEVPVPVPAVVDVLKDPNKDIPF